MFILRSLIDRSLTRYYFAAIYIVSLSASLTQAEGRKCVCTSKACKEAGVNTCRTKFFCYTEFIVTKGQEIGENATTRGCTEGPTPLLCETKSWVTGSRSVNTVEPLANPWDRVPWPKLNCCDSHDYCNAAANDDDESNADTWIHEKKMISPVRFAVNSETPDGVLTNRGTITIQPDRKHNDWESTDYRLLRNHVKALHVAALVLAIAALISVLASCYVVTRFLRNNRYAMDNVQ